jgi:hypothetical protein
MKSEAVISTKRLGFPWETEDPFLYCVHHLDDYPAGNAELGPAASLEGRDMGAGISLASPPWFRDGHRGHERLHRSF